MQGTCAWLPCDQERRQKCNYRADLCKVERKSVLNIADRNSQDRLGFASCMDIVGEDGEE